MDAFIKKINSIPLVHNRPEPFISNKFLEDLFNHFLEVYNSLDLSFIQYKIEKDNSKGLKRIHDDFKSAPQEISDWVNRHYLHDLKVFYKTRDVDITIVFSLFSNRTNMLQRYQSYVPWILHWFILCYKKTSVVCRQPMHLHLYLTPFKKTLPVTKGVVLDEEHVNTAFTWHCKPNNKMVIYREEEWFKVLIHESFHFFGFENFNKEHEILLKTCFPAEIPLYIGEAYSEFWARTLNCFYCAFMIEKNLSRNTVMLNHFYRLMYIESSYSCYQASKVLEYNNLSYQDITGNKMKQYNEKTNVFCYYVVTSILMYEYQTIMKWCSIHNHNLFTIQLRNSKHFVELLKKLCNSYNLNNNLTVLGNIKKHDRTLRMSLFDFL